ncbi:MAG TPA: hypothetical protein VHD39_04570 [Acidimicrobiales bacterium]|nr:hypothetical protein [Acidimicrobiales bacterium]
MPPARRPGGRRAWGTFGAVALAGLILSSCGGGSGEGQSLARQACVHVDRSVTDWVRGTRTGTPSTTAASLLDQADNQLRDALPLAAAANSDDGTWNSLMTTISEGATVDEGHLVPALRAQCAAADANQNVNPVGPGTDSGKSGGTTTVPQNVNPEPASPGG